jgi:hypothetical protein
VTERLLDRVAKLSPVRLALLSLRLGHRPVAVAADPLAASSIPPIADEPEPRVDELTDEEVAALLERTLREQVAKTGAETQPTMIPPSERRLPADLVGNLDRMSDEEVDSLLDELMRRDAG